MNFKNTILYNIIKFLGLIYTPIFLFMLLDLSGYLRIWGAGSAGIAFALSIAAFLGSIIAPFLLLILIIFFWNDYMRYGDFDYSTMNIIDWLYCAMTVLFPVFVLFTTFSSVGRGF